MRKVPTRHAPETDDSRRSARNTRNVPNVPHVFGDCAGADCTVFGCDGGLDRGVLDLDATPPPKIPAHRRQIASVPMPPSLLAWCREQAAIERLSLSKWMQVTFERARDSAWPVDVRDWLAEQAAQCDCPGDLDQAVILVVRHLAKRWPHGGRLR